jgi:hypothetical protein
MLWTAALRGTSGRSRAGAVRSDGGAVSRRLGCWSSGCALRCQASSMPKEMIRLGCSLIRGPSGVVRASATPRISIHLTRQGCTEARSSTTKAALPLSQMLRNFWLFSRLKPPMSIVEVAAL